MNNSSSEARLLAEAALAAASRCKAVKQLINDYISRTNPARMLVDDLSDGEKYRWIRGNRGNHAISDAIAHSDRNKDFDDRIDAAMAQRGRWEPSSPALSATNDPISLASEPAQLRLVNVDFLAARPSFPLPLPANGASCIVESHFDEAGGAVDFCVGMEGTLVHARISASVLRSHYGQAAQPMKLFRRHSPALLEAVRDRVSGGSIEPIVLREYDLK